MLQRRAMDKRVALICLPLLLGACSALPSFLSPFGGVSVTPIGTNVAREVEQKVVAQETTTSAGRDIIQTETVKEIETKSVESIQVNKTNIPPWILLLLLAGWLLPTPQSMGLALFNLLRAPFARRDQYQNEKYSDRATRGQSSGEAASRRSDDPPLVGDFLR